MGQPAVDAGWEGATRFVRSGGEPTRAARHLVVRARDEEVAVARARATRRTICDMVAVASWVG